MRSAIRGDFERLAERRGEQELMRVERARPGGRARAPRARSRRTRRRRRRGSRGSSRPDTLAAALIRSWRRPSATRSCARASSSPRRRASAASSPRSRRISDDHADGKPLPSARGFRPSAEAYLVATRGPLPYMLRLREIEQRTADARGALRDAWRALADALRDDARGFGRGGSARGSALRSTR